MLNLTQGITVQTEHIFIFQKNALQSGNHKGRQYKTYEKL